MSERMLERDEETQNWLREQGISSIRGKVPPAGTIGPECCIECEGEIPEGRRKLGYEKCIYCAERGDRRG